MNQIKLKRIASQIIREVSDILQNEARDRLMHTITITGCDVSSDLSYAKIYFWRTQAQQEIDFVEIEDGMMQAYEFKFNPKKMPRVPKAFSETYPEALFHVVTPENYTSFVGVM